MFEILMVLFLPRGALFEAETIFPVVVGTADQGLVAKKKAVMMRGKRGVSGDR